MEITLLAFATSSDAFGFSSKVVYCSADDTPFTLVQRIAPQVNIASLRVALDCEFATWDTPIGGARELAFIPPVSGG